MEGRVKAHVSPLLPWTILLYNIHTEQQDRKLAYLIRSPLHCSLNPLSSKEQIGVPEKHSSRGAMVRTGSTAVPHWWSCCCCSGIRKSLRKGGVSWNLSLRLAMLTDQPQKIFLVIPCLPCTPGTVYSPLQIPPKVRTSPLHSAQNSHRQCHPLAPKSEWL